MSLILSVSAAIFMIVCNLFPTWYIFHKKGKNKLIYIASCLGATTFIQFSLSMIIGVMASLGVNLLPENNMETMEKYPLWALTLFQLIEHYWLMALIVGLQAVNIYVALVLYKKYEIFSNTQHPKSRA